MKKKMFTQFIMVIMLLSLIPQMVLASAGVTVDKSSVLPGEKVSISGTAGANESVVIKITDEAGNIVFFDAAKTDAGGNYSASFVVPSDMAAGKLTVTAGSGDDVATTTITVKATPKPTAKPTSTPDPGGTAQPTATPSASPGGTTQPTATPSASPGGTTEPTVTPSASPVASGDEPTPTPSSEGEEITVKPKEISHDEETGIITIVIDVADLPEGTVAIQTPGGEILYVSDAKDGKLVIKVVKDDANTDGDIEIVALSDEMTPLSTLYVKVVDENEEIILAQTGEEGGSLWIIIVCIAGAVLIIAAVLWILLKRRNKTAGDDTGSGI